MNRRKFERRSRPSREFFYPHKGDESSEIVQVLSLCVPSFNVRVRSGPEEGEIEDENAMNYGRGMLLARTKTGISKRKLAKLVGVDASYISHIEAGRRKPSLDTIEKIADVLGMPLHVLMLFSSETADLNGLSPEQAAVLGDRLSGLLKGIT